MNPHAYNVFTALLFCASGLLSLYGAYFALVALFGFKKPKRFTTAAPTTRFAAVVAARNEEVVIGNLVDSLLAQQYPKELLDVYVVPNNCTDDTAGVAKRHGAHIFSPEGSVHGKGEALQQVMAHLTKSGRYDAVCVFDADNLVHGDFFQKMNDAYQSGAQAAQAYRDSKNPSDTAMSTCCSLWYWMLSRFYSASREAVGLSALINGSGFMVSTKLLEKLGGWNTCTITEDYEFTAQCALAGERVHYVAEAIIYDEQPLDFKQSWKQRRRWCTGGIQGMQQYLGPLLQAAITRKSYICLDLAFTYVGPLVQMLSLMIGCACPAVLVLGAILWGSFPLPYLVLSGIVSAVLVYLITVLIGALIMNLSLGRLLPGAWKGLFGFGFYLITWMLIAVVSLFNRATVWEAIPHTRSKAIGDM